MTHIWFTVDCNVNRKVPHDVEMLCFSCCFKKDVYLERKTYFLSLIDFYCTHKILLNHYAWKFYMKLPENRPTQQNLYSISRQVLGDIWETQL